MVSGRYVVGGKMEFRLSVPPRVNKNAHVNRHAARPPPTRGLPIAFKMFQNDPEAPQVALEPPTDHHPHKVEI